jgi:hypothetical protein
MQCMNCEETWWHLLVSGLTLRSKTFSKVWRGSRRTTRLSSMNFKVVVSRCSLDKVCFSKERERHTSPCADYGQVATLTKYVPEHHTFIPSLVIARSSEELNRTTSPRTTCFQNIIKSE